MQIDNMRFVFLQMCILFITKGLPKLQEFIEILID
jgi:hypothetical protein